MDGFWRFDSKQGHYSSVLISKSGRPLKASTILCVWRRNDMKAKCHNMEKKEAVFSNQYLCGGKIIESFIPTCEEDGFTLCSGNGKYG